MELFEGEPTSDGVHFATSPPARGANAQSLRPVVTALVFDAG
jgi:hypothetical protein